MARLNTLQIQLMGRIRSVSHLLSKAIELLHIPALIRHTVAKICSFRKMSGLNDQPQEYDEPDAV